MENDKSGSKRAPIKTEDKSQPIRVVESVANPEKVRFLVWFTDALNRFQGVQAHHLTTIRTYFRDLGLGEPETMEDYDNGLIKFGFGRKK